MLKNVASIFDNMVPMLKKVKKKNYEERMKSFRNDYGHFIDEMIGYINEAAETESAIEEVAHTFTTDVKKKYEAKGKINGRVQADMNFFMIYYVFPAILLTEDQHADELAKGICENWNKVFKCNIGYTTYEKLYGSFREKIFGIF